MTPEDFHVVVDRPRVRPHLYGGGEVYAAAEEEGEA